MDPALRTVKRDGELLPATPKVFDALVYLLRHGNQVVAREELAAGIWPGQVTTDANLNQHVAMLRRLIGDGIGGQKFVMTLPGRGYQWVLPVDVQQIQQVSAAVDPVPVRATPSLKWVIACIGFVLVTGGLLVLARKNDVTQYRRHALTRLSGSEYQPVISRDGKKVAFVWDQEGKAGTTIMVKGPGDDEPRRASLEEADHSSPAWSPDGRYLAYLRATKGQLQVVIRTEDSGLERVVASLYPSRYGLNSRHLDWSPDGTNLVVDNKLAPAEPFGLFLIDLVSGASKRLTLPATDIIGDVDPRFSPDGRTVSFVRSTDRFGDELMTVSLSDRSEKIWTSDRKRISGQDWAPDGSRILYSSNRGGDFQVWSKSLDGRAPVATGISSANPLQFSVARTGSALVFSDLLQDLNIWRLDLTAQDKWSRVISSTGEDSLPQLSPDGSKLCFRSDRSGEGELWVSEADGSHSVQVTRKSVRPVAGRWSPDGKQLLFNAADTQRLYSLKWAGGTPQAIGTAELMGSHPMFRPDGASILFNRGGLFETTLTGARPKPLLPARPIHQKMFSPDGKWLYFTGGRTEPVIWRMNNSTGAVEKILDTLLPGYWGAWAVGTKGLYFLTEDQDGASIHLLPSREKTSVRISRLPGPLPPIGTTTWSVSPDDHFLYCVRVDLSHSDLTQVEGVH